MCMQQLERSLESFSSCVRLRNEKNLFCGGRVVYNRISLRRLGDLSYAVAPNTYLGVIAFAPPTIMGGVYRVNIFSGYIGFTLVYYSHINVLFGQYNKLLKTNGLNLNYFKRHKLEHYIATRQLVNSLRGS